jgi:hypothetical protein
MELHCVPFLWICRREFGNASSPAFSPRSRTPTSANSCTATRPGTWSGACAIRQRTHAAVAFLNWLKAHDLTLDTCRQADLDRWLTDDSAAYRKTAGHFIRWARTNKLTTIHVPALRWNGPTQPLDDEHRWDVTRRLLHDDALKPEDRLAGLLLLLYAQGPASISRLTVEDVEVSAQEVGLHLGQAPIQLPEPVAALARTVAADRKGHATIGALAPSRWLFPGGQPGRPISTTQLTQRLNNLGIRPNQTRSTALFQLATEIPAAILARTLGIHTDVAVAWQRLSAGDWATYAAEVSRRTSSNNSRSTNKERNHEIRRPPRCHHCCRPRLRANSGHPARRPRRRGLPVRTQPRCR